jgi:hypothetical protein
MNVRFADLTIALYLSVALTFILVSNASRVSAATAGIGDTTIVAFSNEPMDLFHDSVTKKLLFPSSTAPYKQVIMLCSLSCPELGCDPWDRIASVIVNTTSGGKPMDVEIGRYCTPYGRSCTFAIDVSDFRPLLADSVTLLDDVATFIGGGQGLISTVSFHFIAGTPDLVPYKIVTLWSGKPEFGNPDHPIDSLLVPWALPYEPGADFVKVRVTTTGHGQGNTDDAAEFAQKTHYLEANGNEMSHILWRDDCDRTPCSPQYGSWRVSRAGFCPGSDVRPWDNDITSFIKPGRPLTLEYKPQTYVNNCRPDAPHPDCAKPEYNFIDHARPFLWIESCIVYYKVAEDTKHLFEQYFDFDKDEKGMLRLKSKVHAPEEINIYVYNATGKEMLHEVRHTSYNDQFVLDLGTEPGTYLLKILKGTDVIRRKIVIG